MKRAARDAIRWGIIGVGRFGLLHAKTLQSLPGVELAALCNRHPQRLASAAAGLGVSRTYTDYRRLLEEADVEAVSITTHWQEHFEIALAALQSGKHVLLEKPMAATLEQCRRLVAAADQAAGQFMVGHICRFDPRASLAHQAIAAGDIGRPVSLYARRNLPRAPGWLRLDKISPLMGDGVHDVDLMLWFTDRFPTRVYARQVRWGGFRYPDLSWAMLEFGDEAIGIVETNWSLPENVPTVIDARLEIVGTAGMLAIDCSQTGLSILNQAGLKMRDTDYWPEQHGAVSGALRDELSYFAECIRSQRRPAVITPREAARAVAVIEVAERSAETGEPLPVVDPFPH